jgi:hypothetical protein
MDSGEFAKVLPREHEFSRANPLTVRPKSLLFFPKFTTFSGISTQLSSNLFPRKHPIWCGIFDYWMERLEWVSQSPVSILHLASGAKMPHLGGTPDITCPVQPSKKRQAKAIPNVGGARSGGAAGHFRHKIQDF